MDPKYLPQLRSSFLGSDIAEAPLCQTSCRLDRIGIWGHG